MEHLTVIRSRKLVGPASLANTLKTVDNIFANRCSRTEDLRDRYVYKVPHKAMTYL